MSVAAVEVRLLTDAQHYHVSHMAESARIRGPMSTGPDFSAYDKAMEDPEYRARMERTAPFTEEEEQEMYSLLDTLADAQVSEGEDAEENLR